MSEELLLPRQASGAEREARTPIADEALRGLVEGLFVACQQGLGRYLVQFVRDRELAADLLQDTFHDALASRGRLLVVGSQQAWLYGIARNHALRALRKRQRFDRAVFRLGARRVPGHEREEIVAAHDLLERTLSAEDRALVLLRYLHDFEAAELAEMTGLTPEAVRQRLSRARARLLAAADRSDD